MTDWTNWASGQPDNYLGNQNGVATAATEAGLWFDKETTRGENYLKFSLENFFTNANMSFVLLKLITACDLP